MAETMLVRRGDVVHTRGCALASGVKVLPVTATPKGTLFCSLCDAGSIDLDAEPQSAAPAQTAVVAGLAGLLAAGTIGKTVTVPETGLDGAFEGRVLSVSHEVGLTGRPVTSLLFEPVKALGRAKTLTVDSTVRVEVRS